MVERLPLALGAALVGWLVGALSAWASRWLEGSDESAPDTFRWRLVAPDLLVQALCAIVWAAAAIKYEDWRWLEAGLLAVPLIQVGVTDFRTSYVYTLYAAMGIVVGLAFGWQVHGAEWWTSLAGAAGGFLTFFVLYWFGRLLFRREAMARGDITIATMVGAGAATCTPNALFWGVLIGGLLGAATLLARRKLGTFMPYGPGLCLGGLATLFLC